MSEENYRHVNDHLRAGQIRYTYFILAVAVSAIAFAVTQTSGSPASIWHVPVAAAVLCWGMSFFFGCRHVVWVNAALYANLALLQFEAGTHPDIVGQHPGERRASMKGARQAAEDNSSTANRYNKLQFWLFVAGVIFFLSWHVLEMARRAVPGGP